MDYAIGDRLRLARSPGDVSDRVISNVSTIPGDRTMITFEGSPVWYWTRAGSEWIGNTIDRFRNLDMEAA